MDISRTVLDMLGIGLYDNTVTVVAELIANAYDADAEHVVVKIPLNRALATKVAGKIVDQGLEISVEDDGRGMSPELVNEAYLRVGTDRRISGAMRPVSPVKHRPIMGRKGIGNLSAFGICKTIEVWSAGGRATPQGYEVSHLIIDYDEIKTEAGAPYHPRTGPADGKYSERRGTAVRLRNFLHRSTPDQEAFHRQVSRRFASQLPDFEIKILNTTSGNEFVIRELPIEIDEDAKIDLAEKPIVLEDGTKLPVTGWLALAKHPYTNPEMAGVRIYARGRLAAVTRDFNLSAGFTGMYVIRSYPVGVVYADWIDEDEDLIRTDRQGILWDSEVGLAFQAWGQSLLKELGRTSRVQRKGKTPLRLTPSKRIADLDKPLRDLRTLLREGHEEESKYQKLMQNYPWILGTEYVKIQRHRKLDDKDTPDFTALRARDQYRDVIEIKSPFISVSRRDGELSSEFNNAWNQTERYLNFVRDERDYLAHKGLHFDRPKCVLIAGYRISKQALAKIRGKEKLNPAIVFYSYEALEAYIKHTIDRVRKLRDQA